MSQPVLSIRDLSVRYRGRDATIHAVEGVSFELQAGRVLCVVGESGCGKSTAGMSVLRLLPPEAEVASGEVWFDGADLLTLPEKELRPLRGRRIGMIFQDPVAGLNPVVEVGDQVGEMLTTHLALSRKDARKRAVEVLYEAGLPDPARVARSYPFQLSGGMCQRVMVGLATALDPEVIIADEPTSALDVTVQALILRQLSDLRAQRGAAIMLITHDFGVVAQMADEVAVMYAGRVVESGPVREMMKTPRHPYTHALLQALPRVDGGNGHLRQIPGHPPEMTAAAERCPFIPRCPKVMNVCRNSPPPDLQAVPGSPQVVACYNPIWIDDDGK